MKKRMTMALVAVVVLMTAMVAVAEEETEIEGIINSNEPVSMNGTIDFIDSGFLVIDDARYRITDAIHYFNSDGILTELSSFDVGEEVEFVLDIDRKTIIKLIKK